MKRRILILMILVFLLVISGLVASLIPAVGVSSSQAYCVGTYSTNGTCTPLNNVVGAVGSNQRISTNTQVNSYVLAANTNGIYISASQIVAPNIQNSSLLIPSTQAQLLLSTLFLSSVPQSTTVLNATADVTKLEMGFETVTGSIEQINIYNVLEIAVSKQGSQLPFQVLNLTQSFYCALPQSNMEYPAFTNIQPNGAGNLTISTSSFPYIVDTFSVNQNNNGECLQTGFVSEFGLSEGAMSGNSLLYVSPISTSNSGNTEPVQMFAYSATSGGAGHWVLQTNSPLDRWIAGQGSPLSYYPDVGSEGANLQLAETNTNPCTPPTPVTGNGCLYLTSNSTKLATATASLSLFPTIGQGGTITEDFMTGGGYNGYWPLNELQGTVTHDQSGANNYGTLSGSVYYNWNSGTSGWTVSCNGAGNPTTTNNPSYGGLNVLIVTLSNHCFAYTAQSYATGTSFSVATTNPSISGSNTAIQYYNGGYTITQSGSTTYSGQTWYIDTLTVTSGSSSAYLILVNDGTSAQNYFSFLMQNSPMWVDGSACAIGQGSCLQFSYNPYNTDNLRGTGSLPVGSQPRTMFAWIYLTQTPPSNGCGGEFAFGYGSTAQSNQESALGVQNSVSQEVFSSNGQDVVASNLPVKTRTWTFVAAIYNGQNTVTLFNGTNYEVHTIGNPLATGTSAANIGSWGGGGCGFTGWVQDAGILNYATSITQLTQIYQTFLSKGKIVVAGAYPTQNIWSATGSVTDATYLNATDYLGVDAGGNNWTSSMQLALNNWYLISTQYLNSTTINLCATPVGTPTPTCTTHKFSGGYSMPTGTVNFVLNNQNGGSNSSYSGVTIQAQSVSLSYLASTNNVYTPLKYCASLNTLFNNGCISVMTDPSVGLTNVVNWYNGTGNVVQAQFISYNDTSLLQKYNDTLGYSTFATITNNQNGNYLILLSNNLFPNSGVWAVATNNYGKSFDFEQQLVSQFNGGTIPLPEISISEYSPLQELMTPFVINPSSTGAQGEFVMTVAVSSIASTTSTSTRSIIFSTSTSTTATTTVTNTYTSTSLTNTVITQSSTTLNGISTSTVSSTTTSSETVVITSVSTTALEQSGDFIALTTLLLMTMFIIPLVLGIFFGPLGVYLGVYVGMAIGFMQFNSLATYINDLGEPIAVLYGVFIIIGMLNTLLLIAHFRRSQS